MKCRCKIRSANTYIQTNCLAYICLKISRCCHWIKLYIGRLFCPHLFYIKCLLPFFSCLPFCIVITLNYIVFPVNLWKTLFRLYQNETIHTICNMCLYMGCCTVIDIYTRVQCLKEKGSLSTRRCLCSLCTSTLTCYCVKVN